MAEIFQIISQKNEGENGTNVFLSLPDDGLISLQILNKMYRDTMGLKNILSQIYYVDLVTKKAWDEYGTGERRHFRCYFNILKCPCYAFQFVQFPS